MKYGIFISLIILISAQSLFAGGVYCQGYCISASDIVPLPSKTKMALIQKNNSIYYNGSTLGTDYFGNLLAECKTKVRDNPVVVIYSTRDGGFIIASATTACISYQ